MLYSQCKDKAEGWRGLRGEPSLMEQVCPRLQRQNLHSWVVSGPAISGSTNNGSLSFSQVF